MVKIVESDSKEYTGYLVTDADGIAQESFPISDLDRAINYATKYGYPFVKQWWYTEDEDSYQEETGAERDVVWTNPDFDYNLYK